MKRALWHAANSCMLGGLLAWPLEEGWVRVEKLPMPLTNLGRELEGAGLAHISDLHCGLLVRRKHLQRYVEMVNAFDVDFVVITGDFITTGSRRHARAVADVLSGLRARVGVVACLGNHDYGRWHPRGWGESKGIADFLAGELTDAGVAVLRNESRTFFHGESALQFVGVEDYWSAQYDPQAAFGLLSPDSPVIALTHNPDAAPDMATLGADWVLSGHTHGMATPDTGLWNAVYPTRHKQFVAGAYSLGPTSRLYVNRGIGNKFRVRQEHRPEVTVFTLRAVGQKGWLARLPSDGVAGQRPRRMGGSFRGTGKLCPREEEQPCAIG